MIGFITDKNNDLTLDEWGDLHTDGGLDAYRQHLVNIVRLQQYEYSYDLSRGLNYLGYILGDTLDLQAWEAQLFDTINKVPFVKGIVDWDYGVEENRFGFRLVVATDLGEIELRG